MDRYEDALAIAEDLFHITRKPNALKMNDKDQRKFANGIQRMLWKALKKEVGVNDDTAAAAHFVKAITGLEMPPGGPPNAQERQELIDSAKELVWQDVKKRCRRA